MTETVFDNLYLKTTQFVYSGGDKSKLNVLFDLITPLNQYGYTEESYQALVEAWNAALALPEIATQTEIDECYAALEEAFDCLIPLTVMDKELDGLLKYVELAEKLNAENYTEESYQALLNVISNTKEDIKNNKVNEENAAQYKENLFAAVGALETKKTETVEPTPEPQPTPTPDPEPTTKGCGGGCKGSIFVSIFGILALFAAIVIIRKKKTVTNN
jgi:hypothetical protein